MSPISGNKTADSLNGTMITNQGSIFKPKLKGTFGQELRDRNTKEQSPGPGEYNQTELDFESHRKRIIAPTFKDKRPAL